MQKPNSATELKIGDFTLRVLAHRTLTKAEMDQALAIYLKTKHLKTIPKKGFDTLVSTHGFFEP